jgi:hypothetical protein
VASYCLHLSRIPFSKVIAAVLDDDPTPKAALRKALDQHAQLTVSDIGLSLEFQPAIAPAARELRLFIQAPTPLEKQRALSSTFDVMAASTCSTAPLTADELIPLLVMVILATNDDSLQGHLAYMQRFGFCSHYIHTELGQSSSEASYRTTTLQAALQFLLSPHFPASEPEETPKALVVDDAKSLPGQFTSPGRGLGSSTTSAHDGADGSVMLPALPQRASEQEVGSLLSRLSRVGF